jgi:hypothetical protein
MDHALLHRAQNADVSCSTPQVPARAPGTGERLPAEATKVRSADQTGKAAVRSESPAKQSPGAAAVENPEPDEA